MDPQRSSVGANREIARREVTELWNQGNLDFLDENYAETVRLRTAADTLSLLDREQLRAQYGAWLAGFPDLVVEVTDEAADRGLVIQHVVLRGTHDGVFRGLHPTGRSIEVDGFHLRRFHDGKVVSTATLVDERTLATQLGLDVPLTD